MIEIRIHGRGGQGVVTAAELIAISAFKQGWKAQAFPSFGVERTGAPIEAFARMDKKPVRTREHVKKPDILIIQDATLIGTVDITKGCDEKTIAIINTSQTKDMIDINLPKENIYPIDATGIALDILGKNIVNTVILGAFAKISGLIDENSAKQAIMEKFAGKDKDLVKKNIKAMEAAFKK